MDKSKQIKLLMLLLFAFLLGSKSYATCVINPYFNATPSHICAGESVLFENKTGGALSEILAFDWNYDGGATNDYMANINPMGCFSSGTPPSACQSFYKQFNTPGTYNVVLTVSQYNTGSGSYDFIGTVSKTIIVENSNASANIDVLGSYDCGEPFLVTDNSFNLMPTMNSLGHVTSIYWTLYDYSLNLTNNYYTEIGDVLNVQTFSSNGSGLINLPIGHYWLKMETQSFCDANISDSINFFITAGTPEISGTTKVCLGDSATFVGENGCPDFWHWDFDDGTTSTGSNNVSHIYSQLGSYQVSLLTNSGNVYGYHNIEVINAETPIIAGYKNNCDSTVTYSIENSDPNYTYTWSTQVFNQASNQLDTGFFVINGNSNIETANTANIDWYSSTFPTLPNYIVITVEAHLNGSNCSAISTMKVYPCCTGADYNLLHDTTIYSDTTFVNVNNLIINGTVTFSGGVTFDESSIIMGPLAKIIVDNGSKFEAIHSTFLAKQCIIMNDGIYANTINDSIVFRTNSQLGSSINGLYSSHGAYLKADNSSFMNNLIGIQIVDHKSVIYPIPPPPFTPGQYSITNCEFGISTANPLSLTYPYKNKQPLTGIKISKVEGVNIGDNTLGGNYFSRLRNGITIYNSKVNIYNNEFYNIENQMGPAPTYEAAISINSTSFYDMNNIGDIIIGNAPNNINVFDSCEKSIYSNNSKLLVDNNVFKYGANSIDIYNFKNGTMIKNSRFKDVQFGVNVNNLLGVNRKLDIMDNYFEGQSDNSVSTVSRGAINTINCNSSPNSSLRSKVWNNTIKFAGQKTFTTYGIRVQNSDGIMVSSNFISRVISFGGINADWNNTIGIRVATSQGATITDNYIFGFGKSIETYGNLSLTQFSCNESKIYKYGMYWGLNTSLSNQGILNTMNNHNEWYSANPISDNRKLADIPTSTVNINNVDTIKWYYNSSFGPNLMPNSVYFLGVPKIIATVNNAPHQCVGGSGPNGSGTSSGGGTNSGNGNNTTVIDLIESIEDPEMRDIMFEDLMMGEKYTDLQNEYRAYDARFLYKMLEVDTTMMWLGGGKDADYQHFFDSIKDANIGKFAKVYDLIEKGDLEEATNVNNAISPEQEIFANLKTVLGIYLTTWCDENYTLSGSDYETLYSIARQTPYEGGDAVYTARIMIGFEPDVHGVAYRLQKPEKVETDNDLRLYPNPAADRVIIEFTNDNFEKVDALLQVYSITGKLVYKTTFSTINSFKQLSVDMLKNGIYVYHISISNGIDKSGKLVILKQ